MKKIYYILSALFLCVVATSAQEAGKTVVIKTNVGTMKAILYDDVPNHTVLSSNGQNGGISTGPYSPVSCRSL